MEATVAAVLVAVVAAVPPTLVAALAYRQSVLNAAKAAETGKKVDEVHLLANSNLASVNSALAIANEKIGGLEKLISALTESSQKRIRKNARSTRT